MLRIRQFGFVVLLAVVITSGCGRQSGSMTSAKMVPAFEVAQVTEEAYQQIPENQQFDVRNHPLSTFSIDVDTASYSNIRRFLQLGQLPPVDSVRIEEMINYFSYDDPEPSGGDPFSVNTEVAACPWNAVHRIVRIGLKGKTVAESERPPANLVFLIDVSGSMNDPRKLPLVKQSLKLLTQRLGHSDHIGIVVYAGAAGLVLPSTSAANRSQILAAIDSLQPGGSTNGAMGIRLAYDIAKQHFASNQINRVVLCTDGDFNVGITSQRQLQELIEREARSGIYLTVLGFGMGNLKDSTMEMLADRGNGNYGYVDSLLEARKLLVEQMSGTLMTIAKDVKIQVEFNPANVESYRLIGYENRQLAHRDFNDDTKDAGEIGAGHSVTALYEISLVDSTSNKAGVDPLRYAGATESDPPAVKDESNARSDELLFVKLRYKSPEGTESRLIQVPVTDNGQAFAAASSNLRFAAAVAQLGMLLRHSEYAANTTFDDIISTASSALGRDPGGHRTEFIRLAKLAQDLSIDGQRLARRNN